MMVRLGYMASDFHPKVLILGEKAELSRVAQVLSEFADLGREVRLVRDAGLHASATDVVLREVGAGDDVGLVANGRDMNDGSGAGTELIWWLTRDHAGEFAAHVLALVNSEDAAGSATLECGKPDEIKVVVSFGEWDDDFLA